MKIRGVLLTVLISIKISFGHGSAPDPPRGRSYPWPAGKGISLHISYPIYAYSVSGLGVSIPSNFWSVVAPLRTVRYSFSVSDDF